MKRQATNPNRRLKIISTFAVGIIGIVLAVVLAKSSKKPESKTPELKLPSVEVQIAEATRHSYRIQSQGTALPRTSIRLVSEVSGKVVSVAESFDVGQIFAKGDVLLKIDSRDYELSLAQARSQVAQAVLRVQIEEKEAEVVRREWELLNKGEPTGLQAREPHVAPSPGRTQSRARHRGGSQAQPQSLRNPRPVRRHGGKGRRAAWSICRLGHTPLGELFATDVAEVRLPLIATDLRFIDLPKSGPTVALGQAPKVTLNGRGAEWVGRVVRSEGTVDPLNRMVYVVAQITTRTAWPMTLSRRCEAGCLCVPASRAERRRTSSCCRDMRFAGEIKCGS